MDMPRLLIPLAFGIWLLLPWSQRALSGRLNFARKLPAGAAGWPVRSCRSALGAALYGVSAPGLPPDPRFQTGFGAYPAAARL